MQHYPFEMMPLPYLYDSLEPYIDEETVKIHYSKHYKKYLDTLNELLAPYPAYHSYSLTKLLTTALYLPESVRTALHNNAGGVFNHELYFMSMMPSEQERPIGLLSHSIDTYFGSFDGFKNIMKKAAVGQFGSGYAWLTADKTWRLKIVTTANQDTTLTAGLYPLLNVDVWEHAYYLKYQNRREEYVDNWFNIINWHEIEKKFMNYETETGMY